MSEPSSSNWQALAYACCLALGGVDLTSPAGKMTMQLIAAVAEFERDLPIERTQSGIIRARLQATSLAGRRRSLRRHEQQP